MTVFLILLYDCHHTKRYQTRYFSHRHHLQKSVVHRALGDLAAVVEEANGMLGHADMKWRPAGKSLCNTAPKYRSILSTATVSTLQKSPAQSRRLFAFISRLRVMTGISKKEKNKTKTKTFLSERFSV